MFGIFDAIKDNLRRRANEAAVEIVARQVDEVHNTISRHSLLGSFREHVQSQLDQYGSVAVGVIDVFGSGSHGENVATRLLAAAPNSMRNKIYLHLFDVNERGEAGALAFAAEVAKAKLVVALSVSGGLRPYGASQLAREIGAQQLDQSNRGRAFGALINTYDREYANAMRALSEASYSIPVVTPIWNDGNITAAGLGANTIVTSITGSNTNATSVPGLVDIYMNAMPNNTYTSQSPPLFIGQALELD